MKYNDSWKNIKLGEASVTQLIMGQSPPSSTYNENEKGLLFLQGNMDFGDIYPQPTVYCSEPLKIAEKNDILISVRAPVGEVNISPTKVCIGRGLAAIRCKSDVLNNLFLFYLLKHQRKKFDAISTGSTFKAIRKNDLYNFEIVLPSLKEQKKIAEILSTTDKAIQKVDESIEKTERLKKGLMQKLLTEGIGHTEFKDTVIGNIPKKWEVTNLSEAAQQGKNTFVDGPFGSNLKVSDYTESGVMLIQLQNIGEGIFYTEHKKFTSEEKYQELIRHATKPGDIVIAKMADPVARACIVPPIHNRFLVVADCVKLRPNEQSFDKTFLTYAINSLQVRIQAISRSTGSTRLRIGLTQLKKLKIPRPPITEQKKIAEILGSVDKRLLLLVKKKEKLERIKKGLMNDLLSGKRRALA